MAVLGAELVGQKIELGHRVLDDRLEVTRDRDVVVVDAVDREVVVARAVSSHRAPFPQDTAALRRHVRKRQRQVERVAPQDRIRQIENGALGDRAAHLRRSRGDEISAPRHLDHGLDVSQLEHGVDFRDLVGEDLDVSADVLLESRQLHRHRVLAHQQIWEDVSSHAARDRSAGRPGGLVRDRHARPRYNRAPGVVHHSAQRAVQPLPERAALYEQEEPA